MKLVCRRFKRSLDAANCSDWWDSGVDLSIRNSDIQKYFHLPFEAKTMWFSLYDRPAKNRKKAGVILHSGFFGDESNPSILVNNGEVVISDIGFDRLLKSLVGKTVYIQVEYEE